jgi:hypothetical protein
MILSKASSLASCTFFHSLVSGLKERILALVKDMTLSMSAEDYNPLPDILVNDIWIDFSPKDRLLYDKMERDFLIEIEDTTVELVNHMSLSWSQIEFYIDRGADLCLAQGIAHEDYRDRYPQVYQLNQLST